MTLVTCVELDMFMLGRTCSIDPHQFPYKQTRSSNLEMLIKSRGVLFMIVEIQQQCSCTKERTALFMDEPITETVTLWLHEVTIALEKGVESTKSTAGFKTIMHSQN